MIHHATADIRIQTIMLAWAFGALLEGLVGFGYPWAVVVPILVGWELRTWTRFAWPRWRIMRPFLMARWARPSWAWRP